MRFLSITGKAQKLDYIIANYILKSGIHLENAPKILEKGWKLTYFDYNSEIKDYIRKIENILEKLKITYCKKAVVFENSFDRLKNEIIEFDNKINQKFSELENKQKEIETLQKQIEPIEHLKNVNIEIDKMYNTKFVKFRYGKIPTENIDELIQSIENIDTIMFETEKNEEETWLLYYVTESDEDEVDGIFKVLNFERFWIPDEVKGTAKEYIDSVNSKILENEKIIENIQKYFEGIRQYNGEMLESYYNQLILLEKVNMVKKYVASDTKGLFYLVGWIPYNNLQQILPELKKEDVECIVKTNDEVSKDAPTKLKNNIFVRPFEMIVKMYGTPNYKEYDPTAFVAITAFLMFGFMFGDIGQGLAFLIIGAILAIKKTKIGPVLMAGGVSSVIFGFLYGSIFGKEDIIKPILLNPMKNITTMLIAGIASGAVLIIIAMLLNIKNGIKNKDKEKIFFDKNGLAGLIFYITVLTIVIGYLLKGKIFVSTSILMVIVIIPLLLIMFKDNIMSVIDKKRKRGEKSTIIEKVFEIVEMLLSITSNTISFVRLAAFAINHVGLCMAIFILSEMAKGAGSIAIAVIGNIIVIVLEGLIVAIQVLRLEYYELFSRFYSGDGREYKPISEDL